MPRQKTIFIDISKCMACKTCENECASSHSIGGTIFSAITEGVRPRVHIVGDTRGSMPVSCQHCETPYCSIVCPTHAIVQNETVDLNPNLCIGCRLCISVCPFGAIDLINGKAYKCDLCSARLKQGLLPACVDGCPTKALSFIDIKKMNIEKRAEHFEKMILAEKEKQKLV